MYCKYIHFVNLFCEHPTCRQIIDKHTVNLFSNIMQMNTLQTFFFLTRLAEAVPVRVEGEGEEEVGRQGKVSSPGVLMGG